MIGATLNGAVAAFGTDEAVEKIFTNKGKSNKSVIVAGQTSPRAEVEIIGKEFQLSGKFKFGSGLKKQIGFCVDLLIQQMVNTD